jgi:hypothetical protein
MRIIAELPHPDFKITLFSWNNRYLIKLEAGHLEQTYKVDQFDVEEKRLNKLLDEQFLKEIADRFASMDKSLQAALYRLENQSN